VKKFFPQFMLPCVKLFWKLNYCLKNVIPQHYFAVNNSEFFLLSGEASTCASNQFTCPEGRCIADYLKCNGYPDCSNGADEDDCRKFNFTILKANFKCCIGKMVKKFTSFSRPISAFFS